MPSPFRLWWIACAAGTLAAAPGPATNPADLVRARAAFEGLPLRFESNQGQLPPAVRFQARTGGYTLSLTDRGAVLGLEGERAVSIAMLGGNPAPAIVPLEPLAVRTNYFVGARRQWHTGVANYSRVRYRAVYPGIDVVYYGNPRQLEYDFVLAPGADARAIRMDFSGADGIRLTAEGDLEVAAGGRRVLQKKPVVRQDGRAIEGRYTLLGGNVVGVRLGAYDRSRTLVIDPTLAYATYMGGVADDQITEARMDSQGRLYLAGSTNASSSNLVATPGAFNQANAGQIDVFLAIIDTTGALSGTPYGLLYLTYIGGAGNDVPTGMQIDAQGDVFLTGTTSSINFPQVGNTVAVSQPSFVMGYVLELNPAIYGAPALIYSTYLGGTDGNTLPYAVDLDAAGNIYVLGSCQADDFPVTASAYQGVRWGTQDMFLAELNPASTVLLYGTYLGGELEDDGRAMVVTPGGLVYFAASTESTQFPLAGNVYQPALAGNSGGGNYDLIVGEIDPKQFGVASLVYSTYLGGSDNEEVRSMSMDPQGNLLLTGYTLSSDFPVTADAVQPVYGGNGDVFVTLVNPQTPGFLLYSTYLGGSDAEVGYSATADSNGYLYVTGYTLSADFPVANAVQAQWGGLIDVFVSKIDRSVQGSAGLPFSTYVGAQSINQGSAILVGPDGAIYVGGYTGGQFPVTAGAWQYTYGGGGADAFLLVLTQSVAETTRAQANPAGRAPSLRLHPARRSPLHPR